MDNRGLAQALDNYRHWTILEPVTQDLLNAAAQRLRGHAQTPAAVTDAQIEAGCKARHSPQGWGRRLNQPNMAAWVTSHREEMRTILTAALSVSSTDRQNIVAIEPSPENIDPSPEPLD
jgi:hypothetical protein